MTERRERKTSNHPKESIMPLMGYYDEDRKKERELERELDSQARLSQNEKLYVAFLGLYLTMFLLLIVVPAGLVKYLHRGCDLPEVSSVGIDREAYEDAVADREHEIRQCIETR